jgi:hypothetical protein
MGIGSRFAFVAQFLGRRLEYVYQVETGTRMTLRNRGTPSGFSGIVAPFMSAAMRRANRKDLAALKALLESVPTHY